MSQQHLTFAQRLAETHASGARLQYDLMHVPQWLRWRWLLSTRNTRYAPGKSVMLLLNRAYFRTFDALVTAERTSLVLRRWGGFKQPMIYTTHGAGDREISVTEELAEFDFLLLAGRKHEQRLLERHLIRPGRYETGVYAKLDWMQLANGAAPRLFPNDRKTVLYAPHFERDDTSWFAVGHQVLDYFAAGSRFNLIFAPHVRLFDPPLPAKYHDFQRYLDVPHMLIDLGSERCVDMTYTRAADLYLGDVSSQVVEFLALPRPCVFFNTHRRDWQKDVSYRFWRNGLVIDSADDLERHLTHAFESHGDFLEEQRQYVSDTFGAYPVPPAMASRGADAIVSFLQNRNQSSPPA